MKLEKWQGVVGQLVIDNDKAIIASDDEMKDVASLKVQVAENGKPVEEMRHKLLRDTMRKQANVDVLKVKQHFEKSHDSENAEKVNNLNPGKPAQQFKQIKNEAGADVKIMDRFFWHREVPDSENFSKPGFQLKKASFLSVFVGRTGSRPADERKQVV